MRSCVFFTFLNVGDSTGGLSTFERAGDSTGGVKDEKGLWLACQSTGDSTGGRAHGPTALRFFFLSG